MLKLDLENKSDGPAPEDFQTRAEEAAAELEGLEKEIDALMEDLGEAQALGDKKLEKKIQKDVEGLEKKRASAVRKKKAAESAIPHARARAAASVFATGREHFEEIGEQWTEVAERLEDLARKLKAEFTNHEELFRKNQAVLRGVKAAARRYGKDVSDAPDPVSTPLTPAFLNALKRMAEAVDYLDRDRERAERMEKAPPRPSRHRQVNAIRSKTTGIRGAGRTTY